MSDSFRTVSSDLEMMINRAVESHRRITELETELATLRDSARWIPVEEDVPADFKDVLVWNGEPRQGWLDTDSGWFKDSAGGQLYGVTHWRPMLAPPEPQAVSSSHGAEMVP